MQIHPLVTDTATLARLCDRLKSHDHICVDTEFMRENTYYPELCLVQVASSEDAFAFDPLADTLDMAPFLELLSDDSILKVLHAGGQDIEIFVNLTGKVHFPLFDTQVAAMAMGNEATIDTGARSDALYGGLACSTRFCTKPLIVNSAV